MGVMQKREVHVRSAPSDIGSQSEYESASQRVQVELKVEPKLPFRLKAAVSAGAPRRELHGSRSASIRITSACCTALRESSLTARVASPFPLSFGGGPVADPNSSLVGFEHDSALKRASIPSPKTPAALR